MARLVRDGSIRVKAPLAIAATLLVGVSAFGALAYDAVNRSLIAATELRMRSAAAQIVQPNAPAAAAARDRRTTELAADPAIARVIANPSPANRAAAQVVLRRWGVDTGVLVNAEVRDATGATVVTISGRPGYGTAIRTSPTDTVTTGRLFSVADSVFTEYGAPVREGDRIIGRMSQIRNANTGTPAAMQRLRQLLNLAPDLVLMVGNADGSLWTDLTRRVHLPATPNGSVLHYERDGVPQVAVTAAYPSAPLMVALEMPEASLRAPARRLFWAFVTIGALVIGIGAAFGWWMTAGLTRDVVRLTNAAEAIARGNLDQPDVATERGDEIGRLGRAFGHLRDGVRKSQDSLESQVAARTEELHRAQETLVRKERLATLGQLSSSVGHELRNPLGVMTNAVYFLEMTLGEAPAKVREYLGILRTQIRTSEKIVADLLDFARTKPPQRARVAIADLVKEQLTRVTIPETVRVDRTDIDPATSVYVDSIQIGQILINLVTNAVQAMEETGGTLTIRSRSSASSAIIDVIDTGPGISKEHIGQVFEPLFTTKARGIGLGLSVSRSLALSNGGELTVTSKPGQGATFSLSLPLGIA
jgi:signal transduction histidine kinase